MKKIFLLFITLSCLTTIAQNENKMYNEDYFRCENKWVLLPGKDNDTINKFGFIYLDRQAGFTFSYEGSYHIKDGKKFVVDFDEHTNRTIYRLEPNTVKMGIMPESLRSLLGLQEIPEWLYIYTDGENETDQLIKRGWHYNHVGGSDLAIPILLKAYKKDAHAEGLEFELSYAYNAEGQFDKAVEVLTKALKKNPKNYMFYRELGYSYLHLDKPSDAEKTCKKGIAMSDDKAQQAEMAFNMVGHYYKKKNKKMFDEWAAAVEKYADKDSVFYRYLTEMKDQFGK